MNKTDLIAKVTKDAGLTKAQATKAVNAVIDGITEALKKGDKVILVGFGTFRVVNKKARTARNPKTGQEIKIPARKAPKFVPGKALKDAVK